DMKVVSANRSFYQSFKVTPEEAQGRLLYELGNRQWDIPKLRELLEEVLPKNTSVNDFEVEHAFETIGRRIMLLNARRIYAEANQTQRILLAIEDVTERRKAERDLARHTDHLEVANQELEAFSLAVSHDLRAPLRHIDGFTGLLAKRLDASLDATARRYLTQVSDSAQQMGELIDDLLSFSHIGRAELRSTRLDLSALMQEVLRMLEPEAAGRDIEWVMSPLPKAQADPQLLRLVFQNLLGNALKYTRPKPRARIEIGVTREGAKLIFSIRDNGVGFDMRYVDRLFGVFQRLHSGAEFEGTGIGLANVKRIVQRHGGRVWAEGAVGEGACFYFSLPDLA
ncbi:MAG: sensor histidine kinase, partial [bacterium]